MQYNSDSIKAAFATVARLVRTEQPIQLTKIEGLNSSNYRFFREAITHTFTKKNDGFDLQRIFIIDENGKWHRNSSPNKNPTDETLITLIMQAMTYVSKKFQEEKLGKKGFSNSKPLELLSDTELAQELEKLNTEIKRREIIKEKIDFLNTICEAAGIGIVELKNLIVECHV